jgi:hypothetical protein
MEHRRPTFVITKRSEHILMESYRKTQATALGANKTRLNNPSNHMLLWPTSHSFMSAPADRKPESSDFMPDEM